MARPKSALDWAILQARTAPGPGHYDIDANRKVTGGKFSTANPKTDVDWNMIRSRLSLSPCCILGSLDSAARQNEPES